MVGDHTGILGAVVLLRRRMNMFFYVLVLTRVQSDHYRTSYNNSSPPGVGDPEIEVSNPSGNLHLALFFSFCHAACMSKVHEFPFKATCQQFLDPLAQANVIIHYPHSFHQLHICQTKRAIAPHTPHIVDANSLLHSGRFPRVSSSSARSLTRPRDISDDYASKLPPAPML